MQNVSLMLGIAGGIIAVVVALVGLGRSYLKNEELVERAKILDENRELSGRVRDLEKARSDETRKLETRLAESEAQRQQLNERIALIGRAGGAALALKSAIDGELQVMMRSFGASGGSIYVPVRNPRGTVQGLAFLSIEPFTADNQRLKSGIVPLHSLAGRCFGSGRSDLELRAAQSSDHYAEASDIANYRPSSALNIALSHEGTTIGVLQLLRKEGEPPFLATDVGTVATMSAPIAQQVCEATRTIDSAKLLGLATDEFTVTGTAMVFDITRSSLLYQELASSHALVLLNEFFERMCEIAFAAGGTLDTYMGDGALIRFNVPRELPDHEYAAIAAGLDMCAAFARLRDEKWLSYSPALGATQLRVGVATGPLLRANLGHSQVQHLTVLGYPISVAAGLCDTARRDRSVVVGGEEAIAPIRNRLVLTPVDPSTIAKAARFTAAAYEVTGAR